MALLKLYIADQLEALLKVPSGGPAYVEAGQLEALLGKSPGGLAESIEA